MLCMLGPEVRVHTRVCTNILKKLFTATHIDLVVA